MAGIKNLAVSTHCEIARFAGDCLVVDRQAALRRADALAAWSAWARARELPPEIWRQPSLVPQYVSAWCMQQRGWQGLGGAPFARGASVRPGTGPASWPAPMSQGAPVPYLDGAVAAFAHCALQPDPQAVVPLADLERLWMSWAAHARYGGRRASVTAVRARVTAWARACLSGARLSPSDEFVLSRQPREEKPQAALSGIRLAPDLPMPLEEDHAAAE